MVGGGVTGEGEKKLLVVMVLLLLLAPLAGTGGKQYPFGKASRQSPPKCCGRGECGDSNAGASPKPPLLPTNAALVGRASCERLGLGILAAGREATG